MLKKKLILASASPRRRQLLRQVGIPFEARKSGVEEDFDASWSPDEVASRISVRKAEAVAQSLDNAIVLGVDTIVVFDNRILGKPVSEKDAVAMLSSLSGCWHEVFTGMTLIDRPSEQRATAVEVTRVKFRELDSDEIDDYVRSGSPMDKAGAYGIQDDYGALFVERVEGCFYNVMGLPLARLYRMLVEFQQYREQTPR
jgi:septum formation protein